MVEPDTGLLVVFEVASFAWPGQDPIEPFYVADHDYLRDGPENGTPEEVLKHLKEPAWCHFVWLPHWLCQGNRFHFTMRYAHELQHYRQVMRPEQVRSARQFLGALRAGGFVPTIKIERNWNELDADRAALRIFERLHGSEALGAYILEESRDSRAAAHLTKLRHLVSELERREASA